MLICPRLLRRPSASRPAHREGATFVLPSSHGAWLPCWHQLTSGCHSRWTTVWTRDPSWNRFWDLGIRTSVGEAFAGGFSTARGPKSPGAAVVPLLGWAAEARVGRAGPAQSIPGALSPASALPGGRVLLTCPPRPAHTSSSYFLSLAMEKVQITPVSARSTPGSTFTCPCPLGAAGIQSLHSQPTQEPPSLDLQPTEPSPPEVPEIQVNPLLSWQLAPPGLPT